MARPLWSNLSRRERQIMDIVYRRAQASAAEILQDLPDPPSYSAVRALLRVLEDKGFLRHEEDGPRYVYYPKISREKASRSALKSVLETFFSGSTEQVVATLLDMKESDLDEGNLERLARMIDEARKEGR